MIPPRVSFTLYPPITPTLPTETPTLAAGKGTPGVTTPNLLLGNRENDKCAKQLCNWLYKKGSQSTWLIIFRQKYSPIHNVGLGEGEWWQNMLVLE